MTIQLPESIATYFEVSNGADSSLLSQCFAENPVVRDESHTYQGLEAIRSWKHEAQRKYEFSIEPVEISQKATCITVVAKVTGNFKGSPVLLDHVFQLSGEKIQSLEIH